MNIEDHVQLRQYLISEAHIRRGEQPTFTTLSGGVSNRSVWVKLEGRPDWVIKQALAKLRVDVDWYSAPERIQREAAALRWLSRIIPGNVPQFVFADEKRHLLAMTAVPHPHANWKALLLAGQTDVELARKFGCLLADIHEAVDNHPDLATEFEDRQFFEELRLEPYYQYTATQAPGAGELPRTLDSGNAAASFGAGPWRL